MRRTSYEVDPRTGLFDPEYVNIFGVPFTFLPHEAAMVPDPPKPKTAVEVDPSKAQYEMTWPDIVRVSTCFSRGWW